jgi:hypothetical protein
MSDIGGYTARTSLYGLFFAYIRNNKFFGRVWEKALTKYARIEYSKNTREGLLARQFAPNGVVGEEKTEILL